MNRLLPMHRLVVPLIRKQPRPGKLLAQPLKVELDNATVYSGRLAALPHIGIMPVIKDQITALRRHNA
jgi:hypothetical protein